MNLIKRINLINIDYKFDYKYITFEKLIDNFTFIDQNKLEIYDIKDLNDKQKVILSMFINNYVHTNPTISKYNKFREILPKKINLLNEPIIFRGFYGMCNLLNQINLNYHKNILQIGVFPTILEAYIRLNNNKSSYDFLEVKTVNKSNEDLYENYIRKFKKMYPDVNIIENINNNYDLIIFDIYKNQYILPDIPENINIRYLTAVIHTKYIFKQIILGLTKLNENGDLILLVHGSNHLVYEQIITLLASLFSELILINTDMDFSWRYFIVCKNYKPKQIIIDQLKKYKDNDDILISISDNKILDINFEKNLREKFTNINYKIKSINEFFSNDKFIKKIYKDIYYTQLTKTYKWLKKIFNINEINDSISSDLYEYKKKLFYKLTKKSKYKLKLPKPDNINYLGNETDINNLIYINKYFKLYNLICYNDYKEIDFHNIYKQLFNIQHFDYTDITHFIFPNYNFQNLKETIIIEFDLKDISPLLISLFYILSFLYTKSKIYKPSKFNFKYHFLANQLIHKDHKFIDYINKNKFNNNFQIVSIDENYLTNLNHIFKKLFIQEIILILRGSYTYHNLEYLDFFQNMMKYRTKKEYII